MTCSDEAPAALAAWVRRSRTSNDREELSELLAFALVFRDDRLFNAALDVAEDRRAAMPARVASMLFATMQLDDRRTFDFGAAVTSKAPVPCTLEVLDHSMRAAGGAPIAPRSRTRLATIARRLTTEPHIPIPVANAARCASLALGR